jgi:hypothetical protein
MRVITLTAGAALALSMFVAPSVMAQTLSGPATTCGEFLALSASAQDSAVKDYQMTTTDASLTSNSGTTGTAAGHTGFGTKDVQPENAPQVTAGAIVSACQAASPSTAVRDAFSASLNSSGTKTSNQ